MESWFGEISITYLSVINISYWLFLADASSITLSSSSCLKSEHLVCQQQLIELLQSLNRVVSV